LVYCLLFNTVGGLFEFEKYEILKKGVDFGYDSELDELESEVGHDYSDEIDDDNQDHSK